MLLRKIAILALIAAPLQAFATFGAGTQVDVRSTGADTNGGAFDPGVASPGTDESLGTGTAITVTLTGTTTGTGSVAFTSTTHGPGNFVHIASGAGCTTGWFEILSQAAGVATFDHTMGSNGNACVGTIGGSMLTILGGVNTFPHVNGNTIWIKSGTYTLTSTPQINCSGCYEIIEGYGTNHGDMGTKPLITTATNSTYLFRQSGGSGDNPLFINLSFSNTASTRQDFYQFGGGGGSIYFDTVIMDGFQICIDGNSGGAGNFLTVLIRNTEIKNCIAQGVVNTNGTVTSIQGSYIHNCGGNAIDTSLAGTNGVYVTVANSVIANNTGIGLKTGNFASVGIYNNTFYANTTAQVDLSAASSLTAISNLFAQNNIFYGGTFGVKFPASNVPNQQVFQAISHYNAYGNNSTAATSNWTDSNSITLTADPFTNAASGDYSLNATSGGGVLLKALGFPGAFPGGTSTGYISVGAVQPNPTSVTTTTGNFGFAQ